MKNLKNTFNNNKLYILAIFIFLISRFIYYSFGIKFDANPIYWYHQYLDLELLKNNLIESIYYLHSQPPLFNLFLGVVVKISPQNFAILFNIIYFLIGLSNYLIMIYVFSKFKVNKILNLTMSTIFIISPAAILYENWLFYTYPVQFLLLLSLFLLVNYRIAYSKKILFYFFLALSFIILTRSLFHLIWFLLILIIILHFEKTNKSNVIKSSLIPLAVILIFLIKNLILFGTFSSSWFGMSLAKVTMKYLPEELKSELVKKGKHNKIILIKPFEHIKDYEKIINKKPKTGIKCLDDEYKSSNEPNYNNINYIQISKLYRQEAIKILLKYPNAYFNSLLASTYLYFRSPSDYRYFHNDNRNKINNFDKWYNRIIYGQLEVYTPLSDSTKETIKKTPLKLLKYTGLTASVIYTSILFITLYLLISKKDFLKKNKLIITYLFFNILWLTLIGNLFETGENNRFRFLIEPFYFIIITLLLHEFTFKSK